MILKHFENMISGIEAKLKKNPEGTNARKKFALEIARLGKKIYSGGERIAWCGVIAPFDLLNAMGVTSCFIEFVSSNLASTGSVEKFLESAEHSGYAIDICSYHRAVLGATIKNQMPMPDFMIATTAPCTGGLAVMEVLAKKFNRELFVLDIPQDESDKNIRYLATQIENMIDFVADRTGKPLDPSRLRKAVENTNETRKILKEVFSLAQHIPSPAKGRIFSGVVPALNLFLGTDTAIKIAKAFRDEFKNIIDDNKVDISNEKFRLMWLQSRPQFKTTIEQILEKQYKAAIVVEELNDITWEPIDPENPYDGMARRMISSPLNGDIKKRIEQFKNLAQDYRIHGAINSCHWGCRQGTGARGLITESLKEIGVPVLNLEVDVIDPRNFAQGQINTRLEAFMEMLGTRPSPW